MNDNNGFLDIFEDYLKETECVDCEELLNQNDIYVCNTYDDIAAIRTSIDTGELRGSICSNSSCVSNVKFVAVSEFERSMSEINAKIDNIQRILFGMYDDLK